MTQPLTAKGKKLLLYGSYQQPQMPSPLGRQWLTGGKSAEHRLPLFPVVLVSEGEMEVAATNASMEVE